MSLESVAAFLVAYIDKIVETTILELNHSCAELKKKYPGLSEEEIAQKLVSKCGWAAGGVGFGTTLASQAPLLLPGPGVIATLGATGLATMADFKKTTDLQVALVVKIAALFGHKLNETNPAHKAIVLEMVFGGELSVAAQATGTLVTQLIQKALAKYFQTGLMRKLYWDFLEKIGVTVAQRVTQRQISRLIPLAGPLLVGGINKVAMGRVGQNAIVIFKNLDSLP